MLASEAVLSVPDARCRMVVKTRDGSMIAGVSSTVHFDEAIGGYAVVYTDWARVNVQPS
jgi:hypothetical protein